MILKCLLTVLASSLGVGGCVSAPRVANHSDMPRYPTLDIIEVEGQVIYYRDLSDPCDPDSTAWDNLRKTKATNRKPIDCSNPVVQLPESMQWLEMPKREYVLHFAMRNKVLSGADNARLVGELADMQGLPVRYQVYGAAGGAGPLLERLGMRRATAVRNVLVDAGVPATKIEIMPYDPTIPGLRAVVHVAGEGV